MAYGVSMVTWPMMTRDPERCQTRDPLRAQYLEVENSWRRIAN